MTLNFEEDRALLNTDCIKDVQIMLSFAEWPIFYKNPASQVKSHFRRTSKAINPKNMNCTLAE